MIDLVEQIEARFRGLEAELSDPVVIGDRDRFTATSRAYSELETAAKLASEYRRASDDAAGARELLEEGEDPELREMLDSSVARLAELEDEIRLAMVERDPNDDKNVIIEIRPGAGGIVAHSPVLDPKFRGRLKLAVGAGSRGEPITVTDHSGVGQLGFEAAEACLNLLNQLDHLPTLPDPTVGAL